MERAWIISVGTELTLGQTVDTNAAWLSQRLAELGVRVQRHVTVADELDPIASVIREAASNSDLTILTGGLGPTDDDLTRQALAAAAGTALELDERSLARIRAFFTDRKRDMPPRNQVQAMIPHGGQAIENACGTAPGVFLRIGGTPMYALPGVPFEMKTMFTTHVQPLHRNAAGRALLSRRIRTYGLPESEVGERLRDLMVRGRNPEVGTTAELGEIGVRINAFDEAAAAETLLAEAESTVRTRLGRAVFGHQDDTLASAVGELLVARGETVCTAESCTGGLIGTMLTDTVGSSRYYLGSVVAYSNQAKLALLGVDESLLSAHGAVSEPVVGAMARGGRERFGSTWSLAVTGIAGPGGGTPDKPVGLVYVGLAGPPGIVVRELRLGGESPRDVIRSRAALSALNALRLALL